MTTRFVSTEGPDVVPTKGPDVRFLESIPNDFSAAVARRTEIQGTLASEVVAIIYRQSFDENNRFFLSRQLDLGGKGAESHAGEPAGVQTLSYDIFSIPAALDPIAAKDALSKAVTQVDELGHRGPPGSVGP